MTHTPVLLTPGPLTTSARTRQAMMLDWGSWDREFNTLTANLCQQLLSIVNGHASHHCVPLQGSGTFAVEAAIGTLVPRDGKVLVLINGAYGQRLAKICKVLGRTYSTFETAEGAFAQMGVAVHRQAGGGGQLPPALIGRPQNAPERPQRVVCDLPVHNNDG